MGISGHLHTKEGNSPDRRPDVIILKKCIIFGGNGFIGSHLAESLVQRGYCVKVFDTFQSGTGNLSGIINEVEIIEGNFLDGNDVSEAVEGIDFVFHYVSTTNPATSVDDPVFDIESNLAGSVRLLQAAVRADVKKVIFPSSGGTIYGKTQGKPLRESSPLNPVNPYAISKLGIERYLDYFHQSFGLEYLILRYSNPYGERQNPYAKQGVIPIFLNKIKKNEKPVIYGDGSAIRDYIYIKDAIDATISVFESKTNERVFNIGSGQGTSLNQLIDIMSEVTGKECIPDYMKDTGVYLSKFVLDISRIKQETGWEPSVDLDEGIKRTWEWIKALP
jgi:UDP-glucose 4-epimerase